MTVLFISPLHLLPPLLRGSVSGDVLRSVNGTELT